MNGWMEGSCSFFRPSLHAWLDGRKSPGCFPFQNDRGCCTLADLQFARVLCLTPPRSEPSIRPCLSPQGDVLSDLRAWLNSNLGEQKSQWRSKSNEEGTVSAVSEPNKIHHVWCCFHRCEVDSFAWETFHLSQGTICVLFLGSDLSLDHTYRGWGTDETWLQVHLDLGLNSNITTSANLWP